MAKNKKPSKKEVRRAQMLKAQAEALLEERAELVASWGLDKIDDYAVGDFKVSVQRNATFNLAKAMAELTPEEIEAAKVETITSASARKVLSPQRYLVTQRESTPKVVITRMEG